MNTVTFTELMKRTFYEMMKDVATSIPGHVLAYDPQTQMAQIQIGVVRRDVAGKIFEPPPLINVPVYFAGGKFSVEYQIDPGDEGFILFSQRCIDAWKTTGGVAQNPIMRFHDMSDAAFFPGIRSQPNKLVSFANNGIRLRNADASHFVWLKNNGEITMDNTEGHITIEAGGTVNINGVTITPNSELTSPTKIQADQSLIIAGKEVKEHVHDKGTYKDISNQPLSSGNSGKL
jgi:hypothetical protein